MFALLPTPSGFQGTGPARWTAAIHSYARVPPVHPTASERLHHDIVSLLMLLSQLC